MRKELILVRAEVFSCRWHIPADMAEILFSFFCYHHLIVYAKTN